MIRYLPCCFLSEAQMFPLYFRSIGRHIPLTVLEGKLMMPAPRNLDYFRLGCAAGNYMHIFTSKPVREQMLDSLRRLRLMFEPEIGPMYLMLRTLPDDLPPKDRPPHHERFPEYGLRLVALKDRVRSQHAPRHFYWFMLGEALYHLATSAGLFDGQSLDGKVVALRTGLIATKLPK